MRDRFGPKGTTTSLKKTKEPAAAAAGAGASTSTAAAAKKPVRDELVAENDDNVLHVKFHHPTYADRVHLHNARSSPHAICIRLIGVLEQ